MNPKSMLWLERMMLIRAYEEALVSLHYRQSAPGSCTSVGQEASAVGVVSALGPEDKIITITAAQATSSLAAPTPGA